MNKRQAIAEVRSIANALIEQQERIAKGWDKGTHRDDETFPAPHNSIACKTRNLSRQAFTLSKAFRN